MKHTHVAIEDQLVHDLGDDLVEGVMTFRFALLFQVLFQLDSRLQLHGKAVGFGFGVFLAGMYRCDTLAVELLDDAEVLRLLFERCFVINALEGRRSMFFVLAYGDGNLLVCKDEAGKM